MNKLVYIIFTQFLLIYLQLELGNMGWPLPLALMGAFYIVLSFGGAWGCGAALAGGTALAVLYGGAWNNLFIIVYPVLAGLLNWWIVRHKEDIRADFWMPGVWAALAGAVPILSALIFQWIVSGRYPMQFHAAAARVVWCCIVCAPLFMVFILINEAATEFFGLPRFLTRKVRSRR